jgi:large subunit ribosomal protein L7/L12
MDHEERKLVAKTALLRIGVDIDKETARREAFLAEQALAPVAVEVVAEEAPQAKTAVDLRLVSFDDKAKIKVIKEVRAMTNLGLKEAKELVEGAPTVIKRQIKPEEAEELKAKLVEVGAQIEIA